MIDRIPKMPTFEAGWVWLTGAGPGDPGLLTLMAFHALQRADVVVYDALIGKDILGLASNEAEFIYAGKRGGTPSPKQRDISLKLVNLARRGQRVLRLKGGDPFVFGRGAEEALALVKAEIDFRIIPGVSSGIGGLAYAGIPLTHRETNSVVTFVTGHNASGSGNNRVDWNSVATGSDVLVVFMPLRHLEQISTMLIKAGRSPDEPVAIISKATLTQQKVFESTLSGISETTSIAQFKPPALLVVGQVVRLRNGLDWMGALSGRLLDADPLKIKRLTNNA